MKTSRQAPLNSGMTTAEFIIVMTILCLVVGFALLYVPVHRGSDRSATILNIRNCQQAMRGEQSLKNLKPGDPFTRKDLEYYMQFPSDMEVKDGVVFFRPGAQITHPSADPAVNGDHLWLKLAAPKTKDYVGKYGFEAISDTTGW